MLCLYLQCHHIYVSGMLHVGYAYPHHEQVARVLIKAGADLEKQTNSGSTALMLACQNGHNEVCTHVRYPLQLYVRSCLQWYIRVN